MASPGNRHCAKCIGTLSFPTRSKIHQKVLQGTMFATNTVTHQRQQ